MTNQGKWNLYMSINQKACEMIDGKDVEFTRAELHQIAQTFGNIATTLKRGIDAENGNILKANKEEE